MMDEIAKSPIQSLGKGLKPAMREFLANPISSKFNIAL